jgi:hypothetical protein
MTILRPLRIALRPWPVGVLRLVVVLLLAGQLYVTGAIERRDLLDPSHLGFDASNYYAAGQRLNVGHSLYGSLQRDDRPVPGYPAIYPAPLLSPPLIAVAWRPLALLPGTLSMDLWWFGGLALLTALTVAFAVVGKPRNLIVLATVLVLGLPLTLAAAARYPYLGFSSPVSLAALSGNVNAYLVALFALTWCASSRDRQWLAGSAAALAAALKLSPVVILWWFVTQRSWRSARAFVVAAATLGVAGVVFAGLQANLDFVHLAFGGDVRPTELSVPGMLQGLLRVPPGTARYGTVVAIVVGLAAIQALRNHPRAAFAATILTTIYSSPVVLPGNFALLVAVAAPWVLPRPTSPSEPAVTDGSAAHAGQLAGTLSRDSSSANHSPGRASPVSSVTSGDQRSIRRIFSMFATRRRNRARLAVVVIARNLARWRVAESP